ncbi:MAG: tRNA pseudouridine(38-40) synthase TruA [Candidatus Promineifilaceae bacterium]
MTRYKAIVEYDGTNYFGFQRQVVTQTTVQGELENALSQLTQVRIPIVGAGRTDAGVHARGQVISFKLDNWRHGAEALQRALNAKLPKAIAAREVEAVSAEFHPRFDAKRRAYRYTIFNGTVRSPLLRNRVWHLHKPLDIDSMQAASQKLVGTHDFATFGTPPQGNNTVREVFLARCEQQGEFIWFDIEATAFLKRMVRSLVGSLRLVGDGRWTVAQFVNALEQKRREASGPSAPPQGLVLERVDY